MNQAALKPTVSTENALQVLERAATEAAAKQAGSVLSVARTQTDLSLPVLMRRVVSKYGKSFNQLIADFARLGFGPGKLSVEEYFDLRLFDDAALNGADKRQFVGLDVMRQLWDQVNFDQT